MSLFPVLLLLGSEEQHRLLPSIRHRSRLLPFQVTLFRQLIYTLGGVL